MARLTRDFALLGHLDSLARYHWFFGKLRGVGQTRLSAEQVRLPRDPGPNRVGQEMLSEKELEPYLKGMPPSRVAEILPVRGARGEEVRGCYIDCYFNPADLADPAKQKHAIRKVEQGCELAARLGVRIVSLGGFTSILGELSRPITQIDNTIFTTGNTLTTYSIVKTAEDVAARTGLELASARVVVIGASGDIGSGVSRWFNGRVGRLDLLARNVRRLDRFAETLPETQTAVFCFGEDALPSIAPHADICISVASTFSAAFDPSMFSNRAIICDAGYPKNVRVKDGAGPLVFHGGMMRLPAVPKMEPGDLMEEIYPFSDVSHGCLAEGVLLAMARRHEPFSQGRGNITPERIAELGALAEDFGFTPAPAYNSHGLLFEEPLRAAL
jgi:fatty aldehyde-generating acyl-ACP reductase